MLGGGEVIADALVAGTPRIGVGVVTFVAASVVVVFRVVEDVSTPTVGADGAIQPLSKIIPIAKVNNDFLNLI
jgi:hypothetical protein